jgi:hypothetical protein
MRITVLVLGMNPWAGALMRAKDIRLTACLPTPDEIRHQTLMTARSYARRLCQTLIPVFVGGHRAWRPN